MEPLYIFFFVFSAVTRNYWNYASEISRVDRSQTYLQIIGEILVVKNYKRDDGTILRLYTHELNAQRICKQQVLQRGKQK